MRRVIITLILSVHLWAADNQKGNPFTINPAGPAQAVTALFFYDGSNNLIYTCKAVSQQPNYTWSVTGVSGNGTLTSIVVATNVGTATMSAAHGLSVGNKIVVAGSTTSALNGTYYVQTVGSATTLTITTSGVADATYNTAALTVSTVAPRSSAAIWEIRKFSYTSTNLTAQQSAASSQQIGAMDGVCDNRATTTGATATFYQ